MSNRKDRLEAFENIQQAIELQLSDDGEISEIEKYLLRAIELDPSSLEALQETAHFYDAVEPDANKAKRYAELCRNLASKVIGEMDEILNENSAG